MAKMERIKILIADDDGQLSRQLANFISKHGFQCRLAPNGVEARRMILEWKPKIVLADLMLQEGNAFSLMKFIKNEKSLRHQFIHLIVMSGHNSQFNVKQAFENGAKDYIVKPFKMDDLLKRLVFHCRSYRHIHELSKNEFSKVDESSLMLHLTDLVLRQAISKESLHDKLYNLTRMVSMKVDGVRCSIVNVRDHERGVVVVSNDDRRATGIKLDLNKYPEILSVMNTGHLVAIENLEQSRELKLIRKLLKNVSFNSMIVCPVKQNGDAFGVLSLRMPKEKETVTDNEIRFVEIVGHVVSLVLSNENPSDNSHFWMESTTEQPIPFPSKRSAGKS